MSKVTHFPPDTFFARLIENELFYKMLDILKYLENNPNRTMLKADQCDVCRQFFSYLYRNF